MTSPSLALVLLVVPSVAGYMSPLLRSCSASSAPGLRTAHRSILMEAEYWVEADEEDDLIDEMEAMMANPSADAEPKEGDPKDQVCTNVGYVYVRS